MGRLDRAIRHCKLRKGAESPGELPLDSAHRPRASWNQRAMNSRPEQFGATNKIDSYTSHELLFSLRGLSVVLKEIVHDGGIVGDERVDLLYVADRINLFTKKLEERIRTRG